MDDLIAGIKGQTPVVPKGKKYWYFKNMTMTLKNYYRKRQRKEGEELPDFHDGQLKKIFKALSTDEFIYTIFGLPMYSIPYDIGNS